MGTIRKHGLDICRIFACMLVVMIHTVMLFWEFDPSSPTWAVYNLLEMTIRCGVPLFFMISGALLLSRDTMDTKKQLKRALHFVFLFYAWAIICNFFDQMFFNVWSVRASLDYLLAGGYFHLWFLPAIALCYIALPAIHALLHDQTVSIKYLLLFFCLIVLPVANITAVPDLPDWLSRAVASFPLSHLRYLGYMLLGYWLYNNPLKKNQLIILGVISLAVLLLFTHLNRLHALHIGQPSDVYYGYFVISTVLMSCFVFSILTQINHVPKKIAPVIQWLSSCTMGVYLIHPIFIDNLRGMHLDFRQFNTFIFFPFCYISFLLLSLALTAVIKKIPLVKELVS